MSVPKASELDTSPALELTAANVHKCQRIFKVTGLKSELVWYRYGDSRWELGLAHELYLANGKQSEGVLTVPAYTAAMIALEMARAGFQMSIPLRSMAHITNLDNYMADMFIERLGA